MKLPILKLIKFSSDIYTLEHLLSFREKCFSKFELERIEAARELVKEKGGNWPAIAYRQDYWYLVQLYSQYRHVHRDLEPYQLNLKYEVKVFVEIERSLQQLLKLPPGPHSRQQIDMSLQNNARVVLEKLGFDSDLWRITPLPYEVLWRSKVNQLTVGNYYYHLDGYRLRPPQPLTGLIGGHEAFGGRRFIDSIWLEHKSCEINTLLTIVSKNYGR